MSAAGTGAPAPGAAASGPPLRILFATSECAPWVKTGGLGDVAAALPRALADAGHDVRVLMPAYGNLARAAADSGEAVALPASPPWPAARLARIASDGFALWLLDCPALYGGRDGGPYVDASGRDHADNAVRFAFLAHVAARDAWPGWRPDVLHANDWPTGLAPGFALRSMPPRPATVFTIHNLAFQGLFDADLAPRMGLPPEWLDVEGVLHWGRVSMLKAGVRHADAVSTVSPTYAREIRTEALGFGMDGMMRLRGGSLHGILNGIDAAWNPRTDPLIPHRYDADDLAGKAADKAALQAELGLAVDAGGLLLGFVGRLTGQKGIDLVLDEADGIVGAGGQLAVLGSGDAALERRALAAAAAHPGRVAVRIGFDEALAHRIEAGADCFLMPSRFEPCGLNQMYSLVYGTPPLVHATGGLADTVRDVADGANGNGFVLREPTRDALRGALARVRAAYDDADAWRQLQRRGMAERFDWSRSAAAYVALYRDVIGRAGASFAADQAPSG